MATWWILDVPSELKKLMGRSPCQCLCFHVAVEATKVVMEAMRSSDGWEGW